MNDNKRQAIVWDTIERIAFRPNPPESWLGVYAKTLHKLWGMESVWARFGIDDEFIVTFLNLKCRHFIESVSKYSISFLHGSSDCLHWQIHVDPEFHSKASLQITVGKYPHQQMGELHSDVEAVLNGMLFHPRCHTHLEKIGVLPMPLDQDRGGLKAHEVRICGGIENPYVFLFHLRYQFCLVSGQARDIEKTRLIDLFENAIRNNRTVNPRDLFNF
ncbi:MAG: hypothetical protein JRD93_10150 [Deltaproteobacteria bacterium]|nr:hypothetical protein [Deltaproteobacteria bacterium]